MKLSVLLTCILSVNMMASVYSQKARFDLDIKEQSVRDVLKTIENESQFRFFYNDEFTDLDKKLTFSTTGQSIDGLMSLVLDNTEVGYKVLDNNFIVITPKSLVQQRQVTGKITDEKGNPLPGVNVQVEGTTIGAISEVGGKYSIQIPNENAIIIFSFIGYNTQNVPATGKTTIDIVLFPKVSSLDEVVVIGYGTQRKTTLTGSVTSINNKKLKSSPNINISNSIDGLLPGVISRVKSGEPGRDNATILVRGRSTTGNSMPLVVVDGIQGYSGWERINSNDIESISVLKDASAAIYGSRAANGVILITTKRGTSGKPVIDYSFNQAITHPTRLPVLADSYSFAGFVNDLLVKQGQSPKYTDAELQKFKDGSDPLNYPNINWFDEVMAKYSLQNQQNLSVRGGSENIKYFASGSYTNQDGIFKNGSTNFKTYALRTNLDAKVNKYISVSFDVNNELDEGNYPSIDAATSIYYCYAVPMLPVFYPNGLPSGGIQNAMNPAITSTDQTGYIKNSTQYSQMKLSFSIIVPGVKGLGIDGYFNYANNNYNSKKWETPWTVYDYDKSTNVYSPRTGGSTRPVLTESSTRVRNTLFNLRVKYEKQIDDHKINLFVAGEQSEEKNDFFSGLRKDYLSTTIDQLFAGSLSGMIADGSASSSGRKNFFGRINYGFKEKYLIDINLRYDGSSVFPKGKRWGFFPGTSVAWRISQEKFLKNNVTFVEDLKLRASYGQIGNDAVSPFQFLQMYTLTNSGSSWGKPSSLNLGLTAGVSPNPNITWEVLTTSNIGLDASFWKGLLGVTIDIFKQKRSNILATRDLAVPSYTGLFLPNENIGVVENKGFEVEISHLRTVEDFTFRVAANISSSHNKVIDISEPQNVPEWQKATDHELGSNLYYKAVGIFRTQEEVNAAPIYIGTKVGDLQYEDVNKDNKITVLDMVRMDRSNIPDMIYGLNFYLTYKNIFLSANFTGQTNAWQYFNRESRLAMNSLQDLITNRYTPGSMDSKYPWLPTMETKSDVSGLQSTFWLKDASFARLKTLEVGYNLPQALLSKVNISNLRVFINGNNLFTLDKIKWYDPEGSSENGTFNPINIIYNLGVNLTF